MAEFVQQGQTTTVRWVPPERAVSATATFSSPSGSELGALSPVLDAVVLPVATATTGFSGTTGSGTGILVAGRSYWLGNPKQGEALVRVATVDGASFVLADTPAVRLEAGSTLRGASFTVTLTPALTASRGVFYRIDWAATLAAAPEVRSYRQVVHICRQVFAPAMTPQRAAQYIGGAFPHAAKGKSAAWFADIAERTSAVVERRLLSSGRLPQLVGDHELLSDAGVIALRLQLALEGLVPAGFDPGQYQDQQERELTRQLDYATANAWQDEADNGNADAADYAPITSIRARLA